MLASDGRKAGRRRAGWWPALAAAVAVLSVVILPPASAETLNDALASAYAYNPRLDAERARLRATDEEVARAMSGFRPVITGSADISYEYTNTRPDNPTSEGDTKPKGYSIDLVQPIFSGFQTVNAVGETESGSRAGRETLRAVEQSVLLEGVTAYMDVTRDQAIVRLRENNVAVLSRELKATQDRFTVGEVTRTDVAQAEARRAGAISALELARSNLKTSRASYERVVGHAPGELAQAGGYEESLPKSHAEAVSLGTHQNPAVVGALYREQAARFSVDRIRGELLPQFQLEAGYSDRFDSSRFNDETEAATITGRLRVPLYESGEVYARVRQAKHVQVSLLQEIEQARSETEAAVTTAWFQLAASRAQLESDRIQVDANRTALAGVRAEERVGQRTILDVLDAELELLNAEVQLATTRRTLVVNAYTLLSTIGRLDVTNLGVTPVVYDPNVNYEETRRRWWGVSITHEDGRSEELYVERAGEEVK